MANLETTLLAIAKKYGVETIRRASEVPEIRQIPLGIPIIDYVTTGGIPINRITELYGDFSSLKSYTAYVAIAKFQKYDWANNVPDAILSVSYKIKKSRSKDESVEHFTFAETDKIKTRRYKADFQPMVKKVALVDIEGTYDRAWGERLGIDNEALLYINPSSLNQAIDIVDALLRDEDICLVVIDSMIAMGADAEADSSMENEQMAINARFWNKATRKIQGAMNSNEGSDITLIAINGAYDKVGMVFGDPEKVKNGKNFALAKSISLKFSTLKEIKAKFEGVDTTVGRNITVRNKKNKVGRPYLEGTFYFSYVNDGYLKAGTTDVVGQLVELALQFGIIERNGASYTYQGAKVRGAENLKNHIIEKGLTETLKAEVYKQFEDYDEVTKTPATEGDDEE